MHSKTLLSVLILIHGSLVMGLLLFCGVAFWKNRSFEASADSTDIFIYVVPIVAAIGYFASKYLFQNLMKNIDRNDGLQNKLARYQLASLLKYVLLEASAALALFAYYHNGNALHLVVAVSLIAYLISQRPTRNRFQKDMKFTPAEKKQLDL